MGVTHGLGQRARGPRGVLEERELVGRGGGHVARGQRAQPIAERVDGDDGDAGKLRAPALGVVLDQQHAGPAVVEAQRAGPRARTA